MLFFFTSVFIYFIWVYKLMSLGRLSKTVNGSREREEVPHLGSRQWKKNVTLDIVAVSAFVTSVHVKWFGNTFLGSKRCVISRHKSVSKYKLTFKMKG